MVNTELAFVNRGMYWPNKLRLLNEVLPIGNGVNQPLLGL